MRTTFGVALFVAWGILTVLWVYDAFHSLGDGEAGPLIRAVAALLLMILLAGMEGLEVAVIDRWFQLFPDRPRSDLAAWLAARQLFVALIVTAATILADRESIAVPGLSTEITGGVTLAIFNLTWTGFTVLWFMQIFPKHLAGINPDRYLAHTRRTLFPIVDVVRRIGVSRPGEWTALAVEKRLDWHGEPDIEEAPPRRRVSVAEAWAALAPASAPRRRPPDEDHPSGA